MPFNGLHTRNAKSRVKIAEARNYAKKTPTGWTFSRHKKNGATDKHLETLTPRKKTSNEIGQKAIDGLRHCVVSTADVLEQFVDVVSFEWIQPSRYVVPDTNKQNGYGNNSDNQCKMFFF